MKALIAALVLALPLACSNRSDDGETPTTEIAVEAKMESGDTPVAQSEMPVVSQQKIIREGHVRFETNDLAQTHARILTAVKNCGGLITADAQGKDYQSLYRHITVRVPSAKFDDLLAQIGEGVAYFDRKEITARDVTEEFIDVEARLGAKKKLESRYLELLGKASKVQEILEIEKQLAVVREEIESMEGRLRYLSNQVSMSTLNLEIYTKTAIDSGVTVSYGSKMWNAVKSGFNGISVFFIGLLYIWPLILILVALFFIIRKRLKKKPF